MPPADVLASPGGVAALAVFGDAQTGQLDKANNRGDQILAISAECERQQRAVMETLAPKPWLRRPWN